MSVLSWMNPVNQRLYAIQQKLPKVLPKLENHRLFSLTTMTTSGGVDPESLPMNAFGVSGNEIPALAKIEYTSATMGEAIFALVRYGAFGKFIPTIPIIPIRVLRIFQPASLKISTNWSKTIPA